MYTARSTHECVDSHSLSLFFPSSCGDELLRVPPNPSLTHPFQGIQAAATCNFSHRSAHYIQSTRATPPQKNLANLQFFTAHGPSRTARPSTDAARSIFRYFDMASLVRRAFFFHPSSSQKQRGPPQTPVRSCSSRRPPCVGEEAGS